MCLHTCVCAGVCVGGEVVLCGGVGVVCVGVFVCRENGMHVCDVCVCCVWVIYVHGNGVYIGRMVCVCVCGVVFVCVVWCV